MIEASEELVVTADAISRGDLSAEAAAERALMRLEAEGRSLGAVVTLTPDPALEAARACDRARAAGRRLGPLHGVPLAHKDLFYRAGRRCTFGSPILTDHAPETTATVLTRLDAAGAVDLGTLALSEFAFSPTGYNRHFGHPKNPWNPAHVPGGSSSGPAIAVATGHVAGALGTDTGGSVRHPAAACGVTGLKPTLGRVSRHGVGPLSASLDCVGPIARTARDCARLLNVIAGADARDATASPLAVPDYEAGLDGRLDGVTIAIPQDYYLEALADELHPILEESRAALRARGARLVQTRAPDMALANTLGQMIMAAEAARVHASWLAARRGDYAEVVRSRIEPGLFVSARQYLESLSLRPHVLREYLDTAFADADLVHLPAFTIPVPTIDETTGDPAKAAPILGALTHCTRGINFLGLPALSLPAGFTANGLPAAFQLVGRPFAEALLLKAGHAFQCETDWHRREPPSAAAATP